jgi:serine/threonine protein kinase
MNCYDPTDNFSSADFIIVNQIGEGSFGKIYCVQWIKNNKLYAMKKLELKDIQELKQFQEKVRIVKKLNEKTNHCGFIKIFAENYTPAYNFQKAYNYYIIMELGERDWEKEIQMRLLHLQYYTEYELYQIIYQLVKTLSLMQKYNVTHRDIKPQNILIKNGIYKICDFGEARVITGNGVVIQHIRGSQLYMSPILFYAYNHNILQVMHNSYKSDVFSLGMCILLAATLSGYTLYEVRELVDINAITKIINNKLTGRYSINIMNIIIQMLQVDENLRMDFIQLEEFIKQFWKY